MRSRAGHGFGAQGPLSGVRTILVPPDIVAVARRTPAPVRKRTPWHPQPDGQVRTERTGSREWFSDKLFVEASSRYRRPSFSLSMAVHCCGAIAVFATVVVQTVHVPSVHASSALTMPAMVAQLPSMAPAVAGSRAPGARSEATHARSAAVEERAAEVPPPPIESPARVEPETGSEAGGAEEAAAGDTAGSGGDAPTSAGNAGTGDSAGNGGEAAVRGPYRIGRETGIKPPRKIKDVKPAFPVRALVERAHGSVIIEATIGEDGRVTHAAVVHSVPTLDEAALDAVRQWEYTPSMLNGVAVPVVMLVVVAFTIQ